MEIPVSVRPLFSFVVKPVLTSNAGKETARVLVEHGARVYIACRGAEKAQAAVQDLLRLTGKSGDDLRIIHLDLADLPTIKAGADDFLRCVPIRPISRPLYMD